MRVSSDPPADDGAELPERLEPATLDRYLFEPPTEELTREIERWIAVDPHRRGWVAEARRNSGTTSGMTDVAARAWFDDMVRRTEGETAIRVPSNGTAIGTQPKLLGKHSLLRHLSLRRPLPAAGVGIAIGTLCVLATVVMVSRDSRPPASIEQPRVYRTASSQMAALTLIDGTRVTLAPRTMLTVDRAFGNGMRTVSLSGEAFFDVSHRAGMTFTLQTGDVTTRVLGTTFDVKRYSTDAHVSVMVASGKVVVKGPSSSTTVTAGSMVQVGRSTAIVSAVRDSTEYLGWTRDKLTFREVPVQDVLLRVGQWYGIEFQVSDSSLVDGHVTLTLDHKTSAEALRMLESVLEVSMSYGQGANGTPVVTIHPRRATHERFRQDFQSFPRAHTEVGR